MFVLPYPVPVWETESQRKDRGKSLDQGQVGLGRGRDEASHKIPSPAHPLPLCQGKHSLVPILCDP